MKVPDLSTREISFMVEELARQTARRHIWHKAERKQAIQDCKRIIEMIEFVATLEDDDSYEQNYEATE